MLGGRILSGGAARLRPLLNIPLTVENTLVRFASGKKEQPYAYHNPCKKDYEPRCSAKRLAATPCAKTGKLERIENKKEYFRGTLWENFEECCPDPCDDPPPRMDDTHYKPSDKAKRIYRRTWNLCPKQRLGKRLQCGPPIPPPFVKRLCPPTACKVACGCKPKIAIKCDRKKSHKCMKITAPGCRTGRTPPKCKRERGPSDCKKPKCPFPAFSECKKPPPNRKRAVECFCLEVPAMCEVYAEMRKRKSY